MAIYETNTTCSLCTRHCAHWCKIEVKAAETINKITHGFIHSNKLALTNINSNIWKSYAWLEMERSESQRQSFDAVEHNIKAAPLLSKWQMLLVQSTIFS